MSGDIAAKFIDLLRSVVPKLSRVAMLTPSTTYGELSKSVHAAAQKAGVKALMSEASTPQEIENAFSMMVREKADAVFVGSPTVFAQRHRQIAELALKYRLPSLFQDRVNVEVGGLMSYGQKLTDNYLRSATYVDKIFKGAKPGDLPVEQPVSF
jgi:putative ABC transport system substrate-binding protein